MATTYLSRTFGTDNSAVYKWTYSFWVKRGLISETGSTPSIEEVVTNAYVDNNTLGIVRFNTDNTLEIYDYQSGYKLRKITNRKFRDCSAYYNIVISNDNSVASPVFNLYINGVEETSFSTDTNYTQNQATMFDKNVLNEIGRISNGSGYFSGLISHAQFVDGAALGPTEFGEVDATSGIWKIKTACYATPGDNGFCLKMETTTGSAMGTDSSGEGNNFTEYGSPTQAIDNPSNVMATLNPLDDYYSAGTFSNGNTTYVTGTNATPNSSTIGVSKGKFYWEVKYVSKSAGLRYPMIGISSTQATATNQELGHFANDWAFYASNVTPYYRNNNTNTSYGTLYTEGDIVCVALDADNSKLYFRINDGSWENSGDPTSGATGTGAISITAPASTPLGAYFPTIGYYDSENGTFNANFGNGYFGTTIVSSAGTSSTDDDSIWEYDCPTGYYGLNTNNLNTYG